MAGGKETPRQKMIGMMYLVLTALLALNVSKQILDAFVAIEENSQNASLKNKIIGDSGMKDMESAFLEKSDPNAKKRVKQLIRIAQEIDSITAVQIKKIDDAKLALLSYSGEDLTRVKNGDLHTILWSKTKNCTPAKLNLLAVNSKEEYDKPMEMLLGNGADLKHPDTKALGMSIFNSFSKYRCELVNKVGTWSIGDKSYRLHTKPINDFKDQNDLTRQLKKMIANSSTNPDEIGTLMKIYSDLSLSTWVDAGEIKNVHWLGRTFDHSPLVAAIASLTSMEQSILAARADAIGLLKERAGTGEYSFNKVQPLAFGPGVVNVGEDFEVQVMMAAFDSDNNPIVTGATSVNEGVAIVRGKGAGNEVNFNGNISILKRDGSLKTMPWSTKVIVAQPQGTVSMPKMLVLYRGYKNEVQAVASGYPTTKINGTNVTFSGGKNNTYIATPGAGKTATISVTGYNPTSKKSVTLNTFTFQVRNMPKPEIFWANARAGDKANFAVKTLSVKLGPEHILDASFTIKKWVMSIPNMPKPLEGKGNQLTQEAMVALNQVKSGSYVTFSVVYDGTGVVNGTNSAVFKK